MPKNTVEYGRNETGKFVKGNPGKPKGATNRTSREVRQIITDFLHDKSTDLYRIYDTLDDKDKATMLLHFSRLIVPSKDRATEDEPQREIIIDFTENSHE